MKTKFNLSEIMRNAHKLFKTQTGAVKSFADCLRAAWHSAKSYIGKSISMSWLWGAPCVCVQESAATNAAITADYEQGYDRFGHKRYFGD